MNTNSELNISNLQKFERLYEKAYNLKFYVLNEKEYFIKQEQKKKINFPWNKKFISPHPQKTFMSYPQLCTVVYDDKSMLISINILESLDPIKSEELRADFTKLGIFPVFDGNFEQLVKKFNNNFTKILNMTSDDLFDKQNFCLEFFSRFIEDPEEILESCIQNLIEKTNRELYLENISTEDFETNGFDDYNIQEFYYDSQNEYSEDDYDDGYYEEEYYEDDYIENPQNKEVKNEKLPNEKLPNTNVNYDDFSVDTDSDSFELVNNNGVISLI